MQASADGDDEKAEMGRRELTERGSREAASVPLLHKDAAMEWSGRLCECGKPAALKVASARSENRGLRYLTCRKFVLFAKKNKRNYCNFFEWIDPPRVSREEIRESKREARAKKRQMLQDRAQSSKQQTVIKTRAAARYESEASAEDSEKASEDVRLRTRSTCSVTNEISVQASTRQDGNVSRESGITKSQSEVNVEFQSISTRGANSHLNAVPPVESEGLHGCAMLTGRDVKGTKTESVKCLDLAGDKDSRNLDIGHSETEVSLAKLEAPLCFCSQLAVMKTAKSKGPNQGLRYWICENAQPLFAKRKHNKPNGCKFFMWVDSPRATRQQIREARKDVHARKRLMLKVSAQIQEQQSLETSVRSSPSLVEPAIENTNISEDLQTMVEDGRPARAVGMTEQGSNSLVQVYNSDFSKIELQKENEGIHQSTDAKEEVQVVKAEASVYSKIWDALPAVVVEGCEVRWQEIESSGISIKGIANELQKGSQVPPAINGERMREHQVDLLDK